jgi:hypothetical protein
VHVRTKAGAAVAAAFLFVALAAAPAQAGPVARGRAVATRLWRALRSRLPGRLGARPPALRPSEAPPISERDARAHAMTAVNERFARRSGAGARPPVEASAIRLYAEPPFKGHPDGLRHFEVRVREGDREVTYVGKIIMSSAAHSFSDGGRRAWIDRVIPPEQDLESRRQQSSPASE